MRVPQIVLYDALKMSPTRGRCLLRCCRGVCTADVAERPPPPCHPFSLNPPSWHSTRAGQSFLQGGLFFAAAGNAGKDIDVAGNGFWPAQLTSEAVIAVASTDKDDALSSFSNYGRSVNFYCHRVRICVCARVRV